MSRARQVRLERRGRDPMFFGLPKTLWLPWWPNEVTWSKASRWVEQERPGRLPVLLAGDPKSRELRMSYLLREADGVTSVEPHLRWLRAANESTAPLFLAFGPNWFGLVRVGELSVVEVRHNTDGAPSVADVSVTIYPAEDVELSVGPVKTRRRRRNRDK